MKNKWLEEVTRILKAAGFYVIDAYPAYNAIQPIKPTAAIQLGNIDCKHGKFDLLIHILSPRTSGGMLCQNCAADASAALYAAGFMCHSLPLEYLKNTDCFCVEITVEISAYVLNGKWVRETPWKIKINDQILDYVAQFSAEQNQHRRFIGTLCENEPAAITPADSTGWQIHLTQKVINWKDIPSTPNVPFELTAEQNHLIFRYSNCLLGREKINFDQSGITLERWGFALRREVQNG